MFDVVTKPSVHVLTGGFFHLDIGFDLRLLAAKVLKDGELEPQAAEMLTDAADYLDWLHEVLWLENERLGRPFKK